MLEGLLITISPTKIKERRGCFPIAARHLVLPSFVLECHGYIKGHGSIASSSRSKRLPCFIVLARRLRSSSRSAAFFSRQRNRRDFGRTRVKLSPRLAA